MPKNFASHVEKNSSKKFLKSSVSYVIRRQPEISTEPVSRKIPNPILWPATVARPHYSRQPTEITRCRKKLQKLLFCQIKPFFLLIIYRTKLSSMEIKLLKFSIFLFPLSKAMRRKFL